MDGQDGNERERRRERRIEVERKEGRDRMGSRERKKDGR